MATIAVNSYGLLDPGLHVLTLGEIDELFGQFQGSDKRLKLLERLRQFVKEVRAADNRIAILVDGSFIMSKVDEPGDIDLVLILPKEWDFTADLRPFEYNVVCKRMIRKRHGFDVLIGVEGEESEAKAVDFFAQVNVKWNDELSIPLGTTKGLVKVAP